MMSFSVYSVLEVFTRSVGVNLQSLHEALERVVEIGYLLIENANNRNEMIHIFTKRVATYQLPASIGSLNEMKILPISRAMNDKRLMSTECK